MAGAGGISFRKANLKGISSFSDFMLSFSLHQETFSKIWCCTKQRTNQKHVLLQFIFHEQDSLFDRFITKYRDNETKRNPPPLTAESNCIKSFDFMHCCLYSRKCMAIIPTYISNRLINCSGLLICKLRSITRCNSPLWDVLK